MKLPADQILDMLANRGKNVAAILSVYGAALTPFFYLLLSPMTCLDMMGNLDTKSSEDDRLKHL